MTNTKIKYEDNFGDMRLINNVLNLTITSPKKIGNVTYRVPPSGLYVEFVIK